MQKGKERAIAKRSSKKDAPTVAATKVLAAPPRTPSRRARTKKAATVPAPEEIPPVFPSIEPGPERFKVLLVSAEVAPFAKTGGLGDVCGTLPKALASLGHDVRVVLPAYRSIIEAHEAGRLGLTAPGLQLSVPLGGGSVPAGVLEGRLPGSSVPAYFIAERHLVDRPQIYGYDDDPYRFAFFSRAALELIPALGFRPDVVHAHDWHAAPAVLWLATAGQRDDRFRGIPTVFTIHNLAHQGRAPWSVLDYLGVATSSMVEEGYGRVNFMARGIYHATMVSTVSPTYAREIMTAEAGEGLDRLLRFRHFDVHGILNGLDHDVWNPATDPHLAARFDVGSLGERLRNKRVLQERSRLARRDDVPLVAMVTRLDRQKGLDILGHVLHLLLNETAGEAQFVVLGRGERHHEEMFAHLAGYHWNRMTAFLTFSNELASLIYGGSDIFLMPSRWEPCGLGQLIAMRYGSVPVVRATGGLADTVQEGRTGFLFGDFSVEAFWDAVSRALHVYNAERPRWTLIQQNGMRLDSSWRHSALGYSQVYQWAISRVRGW